MRDKRKDQRGERGDERRPSAGESTRKTQPMGEPPADEAKRESGEPGGGQGRRDVVSEGDTAEHGVRPLSAGTRPGGNAELRGMMAWGQGERGAEGYEDSGGSELVMRGDQLLGGLTAGPSGAPTIDIHGEGEPPAPPAPPAPKVEEGRAREEKGRQEPDR